MYLHEVVRYLLDVDSLKHHVSAVTNVAQNINHRQVANTKQVDMIYIS